MDLRERALEVARTTLARRWSKGRFELEVEREGEERWSHVFERPYYEALFRLLEPAGLAHVALSPGGAPRVRFPFHDAPIPTGSLLDGSSERAGRATAREIDAVSSAAEEAARRAGHAGVIRAHVEKACASRTKDGRVVEARVRVLVGAPDGAIHAELDAATGERLGFFLPAFLRGSRNGCPLSKEEAIARSAAEEPPPPGAVLVRADLEEREGVRLWRIVYDVATKDLRGRFTISAHARTGAVAGVSSSVRRRTKLGRQRGGDRDRAAAEITGALPGLLGDGASLAALVPGALVRQGRVRPGWIGTAITSDGRVARVSLWKDELQVAFAGRAPARAPAAQRAPDESDAAEEPACLESTGT
ncbi:hypothetical protein HY251_05345 [bacterium]|nr:hypothetical protein [bacterium]